MAVIDEDNNQMKMEYGLVTQDNMTAVSTVKKD